MNSAYSLHPPNGEAVDRDLSFEHKVFKEIFDEWLMERMTVAKVKQRYHSKIEDTKGSFIFTTKELKRRAKERYGSYRINLPNLNLFFFPQTTNPYALSLLEGSQLLKNPQNTMQYLQSESEVLKIAKQVFWENDLVVQTKICANGCIEIVINMNKKCLVA